MVNERFVDYVHKVLDSLYRYRRAFRFISNDTVEAGLWIAYDGFDLRMAPLRKMSTSISSIFDVSNLPMISGTHLVVSIDELEAVSYTTGLKEYKTDPVTHDTIFITEFELAYYEPEDVFSINEIRYVRLMRTFQYTSDSEKAHKSLCYRVQHRPYARYPETWLTMPELIDVMTLLTTLFLVKSGSKIEYDFAYAWDSYWENKGMLSAPPSYNYVKTESELASVGVETDIETAYYDACTSTFLRYATSLNIKDRVADKIYEIIHDFYGAEVMRSEYVYPRKRRKKLEISPNDRYWLLAQELYRKYPQYLDSPEEAYAVIKQGLPVDESTLRSIAKAKRQKLLGEIITPEQDPDVVLED